MRLLIVIAAVVACLGSAFGDDFGVEEQLRVLSRQVTTLLERRREDLASIEDNMRRKILASLDLRDVHDQIHQLRNNVKELHLAPPAAIANENVEPVSRHEQKNEHLTLKWLSNAVTELKTEIGEVQTTLNATVILQNHELLDTELSLLKSDVSNLNGELEAEKRKNARYEAQLAQLRDEIGSVKDQNTATAVLCGKTKNQLRASQLEWAHNWQVLKDVRLPGAPPRHQRLLKKHLAGLEKAAKLLRHENDLLRTRLAKLEEKFAKKDEEYDRINGNEIQDYIRMEKVKEVGGTGGYLEQANSDAIANLTQQMSNFDKLHMSMLELLENVENIENKVDVSVPELRKEISKLEAQLADAIAQIALLREDQTNTRSSVKAIGVSVSNMQDKTALDRENANTVRKDVDNLMKAAAVQTSKLHDHILKSESSTMDQNSTKSTIHLVQELKSFETEYKSIVNKLPHDCSAVSGPSGIYLISPGDSEPILASCADGWTTIQKRYDGSVDFNRNWNDYSTGFGTPTGEHWLGNRALHRLTLASNCTRLQINMKDIYGKRWQANYEAFSVADYSAGFKLLVGGYSGNASDAFDYQNRMEFSTLDNDRDISNTHCASNYEGGWWFSHCQHANLNGRYNLGLTWFDSSRNEWIAVSESEMRVKVRATC